MFRAAFPLLAILLLVASCSSDSEGESSGEAGAADSGDSTTQDETSAGSTTTLETFTPAPEEQIETPFSLPPLDTDEIDVMLEEALDDDEVTADEIAAVLTVAGLAPDVAECEAELLVELGVEDVGGAVELQRAVEAMTPEITARLSECLQS